MQYHDLSQNGTSAYAQSIPAGAGLGFHSVSWAMSRTHHGYCHWCWRWAEVSYDSLYLHAPLCRQCSGRPLATHDHGYCYWCWRWAEVWYSGMSVFNMPLCNSCARRHLHGLGPPWYPNHVQRCELLTRRVFHWQARGHTDVLRHVGGGVWREGGSPDNISSPCCVLLLKIRVHHCDADSRRV